MALLFDKAFAAGQPEILLGELEYRQIFEIVIDVFSRDKSMTFYNLFLFAGNNKEYIVYVKDRDLIPIDLTGATGVMTWRKDKDSAIALQLTTANPSQGMIVVPTQGEVRFFLQPSDTILLTPRQYVFDVQLVTSTNKVYTVLEGVVTLKAPVT